MNVAENIEGLIPIDRILPYYKIAQKVAKESPCQRRRFGAVIGYTGSPILVSACNSRVSSICDHHCIRDRYGVVNGARTELGAEVHAEQAVLIDSPEKGEIFVLAGWQVNFEGDLTELKDIATFPCLPCARMIKYAGYKWVYMMGKELLTPYSINDIISYREQELGPHYE
jgi:deoxycytidylate deaminase